MITMKKISILIYQILIWLPVSLTLTIITALTVTIGCICGGERFFAYYPGAWWSRAICLISLCPVKITGRRKLNRKQSYIFASNHQGAFDIFLIYGYIGQPIKWVMKKSLMKLPFVGFACRKAGFIPVDTSSQQAAAKTIETAEQHLRNGNSIVIFPEGTRSKTGRLQKFKKGASQMAIDMHLPIVPVTLNGTYEVMPPGSFLLHPRRLEIIIHDPIPTANIRTSGIREAATQIRELTDLTSQKIRSALWEHYKPKTEE
jgi:1-acyl-sn-glycerol-3-phosphate acyltransferase